MSEQVDRNETIRENAECREQHGKQLLGDAGVRLVWAAARVRDMADALRQLAEQPDHLALPDIARVLHDAEVAVQESRAWVHRAETVLSEAATLRSMLRDR